MKRMLLAILILLPAVACAQTWQVDAAHSTLGFDGSFQGGGFHGVFKSFDAEITYDPANLENATFDVTVQLASVDTQASERDDTLKGADFFDVSKTPHAHFVTQSFSKTADGAVVAHGTLQLHGHTQPVTLTVDFMPTDNGATLDVATTVQRLDFGLGASKDWADISKAITVHGHLVLN